MRDFWILLDELAGRAALLGVLAPFIGGVIGLATAARVRGGDLGRATVWGFGGGLVVAVFLWNLTAWIPPGEGRSARDGRIGAARIRAAVARFREREGRLPNSLAELRPPPLAERVTAADSALPLSQYTYRRSGAGYVLSFQYYHDHTVTECRSERNENDWQCRE